MWQQHLDGERPLGVVPVRLDVERTLCRWGCGDVDDYGADVVALVNLVARMGYPLVPCRSKSGGLHLFLFLREWEDPAAVQTVLRDMMASLGYADAEVFPKQTRLVDERDKGSWIVMPYFGGDFDGRLSMQRGVRPGGGDMTAEEFLDAAEAARTRTGEIKIVKPRRKRSPRPEADADAEDGIGQAYAKAKLRDRAAAVRAAPDGTANTEPRRGFAANSFSMCLQRRRTLEERLRFN